MKRTTAVTKTALRIGLGGMIGYSLFWLTSHPTKSPVRKMNPRSVKSVSYFPNITISRRDKTYWMHHWMNLSALYVLIFLTKRSMLKSKITNGFLIGSILQGLMYKDRFKIVVPKERQLAASSQEHEKK